MLPAHQGKGLGKWLVGCVGEVLEGMKGELRRALLITRQGGGGEGFYEKELGMRRMEGEGRLVVMSLRGEGSCV